MSRYRLLSVIGAVVGASGVAMFAPVITALIYGEYADALQITLAAGITIIAGTFGWRYGRSDRTSLTVREGFAIVGLSWIAMTFFGTLPYLLHRRDHINNRCVLRNRGGIHNNGSLDHPRPRPAPQGHSAVAGANPVDGRYGHHRSFGSDTPHAWRRWC